ncbi:PREDICTED: hydroxyacylglutathione hydrolase cytoplasmic isoform X1 [Theobroma cacao]|uniref:hydroxyacylglutathione hydrolase n=1 Tax=Theobroma cacao TaxID=3641 RepID=A0AB32X111_THECC|nr:PREDICTED: hydroxyacylglutathione hydrolase cytoplasmic isoform X1 [Theobroma cacao]
MKILEVPCLEDNYSYLIIDESTKEAAAVDPAEPQKVVEAANQQGVVLKLVLTTHHHWDHAGGNDKIKGLVPGIKVYGGSLDNVRGCTDQLQNGDNLQLTSHINILSLHTPWYMPLLFCLLVCLFLPATLGSLSVSQFFETLSFPRLPFVSHTKGHISYYVTGKEGEDPAVFTGDTLFIAGCGKFFEGTAEQMYQSLCVTLGSLPKPTRVFCGHEYTVKNLQFALTVEPKNARIQQKLAWATSQRQAGLPTIPSTIEEELETNPFMRVDLPELQGRIGCQSPVEALREIRRMKDNWRG